MHRGSKDQQTFRLHLALATFVYVFDQATKVLILNSIEPFDSVYITGFLNFVLVFNKGVAFGIFSDLEFDPNSILLFTNTFIVLVLVIGLRFIRNKRNQLVTAIFLVIGGALGNITDRVVHGHVIDFVDFHIGNWHYATFNIADSAISIGTILIALELFKIRVLFRRA